MTLRCAGFAEMEWIKYPKSLQLLILFWRTNVFLFFLKKGGCGFLRVGLEDLSLAALRRGWAADRVSDTQVSRFDLWETTEVIEAVCAD